MARGPQHSKNWGGARPGSGSKRTGPNRMTLKAIEMAEEADVHPYVYLLSVVADKKAAAKDRLNAAAAALPYCLSKQATQLIVTNDLEHKTVPELEGRLMSVRRELLEMGSPIIEGELVQ
jgi:hypothetical protein